MSDRRRMSFNNDVPVNPPQNDSIELPLIVEYKNSGTYEIPSGATTVQLFIVGGGGGGSGDCLDLYWPGCGGNGGEVITKTVSIGDIKNITITIGNGGTGGSGGSNISTATSGENTSVKLDSTYTARGGSKAPSLMEWYDSGEDNSIRPIGILGGLGEMSNNGTPGKNGIKCDFIEANNYYGASGGGGSNYYYGYSYMAPGGLTGGGTGGGSTVKGGNATFYGAGGGGGAASSGKNASGGNGYKGIVLARYSN